MLVMARSCLRGLFAFSLFALSLSEDPVADFCRRWGHQTAQVNGRLYIDGGQVAYNTIQSNYTNEWLLYSDLNSRSEGGMPRQYSIAKNATVPRLSGGYLWADEVNKCFYQFGGEFFDSPKQFGVFTYDAILNQWNTTNVKNNDKNTVRPAYGAGTQTDSRGLGFYYGGWVSNKTSPGWQGPRMALSSMMQFDFTSGVLKNVTHPDGIGRAEGQMVFLPVSDGGVLIYFGGVEDPYRNGTSVATTMTKIHIYDINSNRWYSQTATGDVPAPRRQFCAGVIWADDRSSYNIYIYGGYGFSSPPAFDDAYILSLPSFKWFKGYPLKTGPSDNLAGHGGCTANVVTPDQMLVIGGWFPNTTFGDCDAADLQGQHNMILGNNTGREENGLWDKYDPKRSKYEVPAVVVSAIGGGPTGGATVTAPATWDYEDLRAYYKISFSSPTRTATRELPASLSPTPGSGGQKKNNLGPILGGVLGGLAFLIAVLVAVLLCFRRRKKSQRTDPTSPTQTVPPAELAVGSPPQEMSTPTASKYIAVHERQASNDHSGYTALAPMQSRSLSYDQSSSHSHRQPSYHSTPPIPAPHYGSPHDTVSDHHAFSPSRSPQHNADLFFPADYGSHNWQDQTSPPLPPESTSPGHRQRQHSYPTPTSPLQSTNISQQAQVYYPPPPDPGQRQGHQHHLSVDEHRGSPVGTQYSGETQHGGSAGASNITTPSQFYAQPVATQGGGYVERSSHHGEYTR